MSRKTTIFILLFTFFCFNLKAENIQMPILKEGVHVEYSTNLSPNEDRDEKYFYLLSQSVKINSKGSSGSGTIIYYDSKENYAYVISCGHLWDGNKNFVRGEKLQKANITTWYKNNLKLNEPKTYEAEVLFWSNSRGQDVSLLRFSPDWNPNYFSVANRGYNLKEGIKLNSLGCDGGREVSRYEVEFVEYRDVDLITKLNSPRPGRSGGGLITNEGLFVGICWGTSDVSSGNGIGYFTPINSIYDVFDKNNHLWVLEFSKGNAIQQIPIYDWCNPSSKYEKDYIPIPYK